MPLLADLDHLDDDELASLYAYPASLDRAYVRANFVATLDGAATGDDGRSGSINNAADGRVFGLLRGLADVVLAGAGTVRVEGYRPVRTREPWTSLRAQLGLAPSPVLAVVTRSLQLPDTLLDRSGDAGTVIVVTTTDADPAGLAAVRERLGADAVLLAGEHTVDLGSCIEQLAERGLPRVLCEGGPQLMNALVTAGRLDELCLTLTPTIVGGTGPRIAGGAPVNQQMRLAHLVEADSVLLTRWLRRADPPPPS